MSAVASIIYQPLIANQNVWAKILKQSIQGVGLLWLPLFVAAIFLSIVVKNFYIAVGAGLIYFVVVSKQVTEFKNAVWDDFALANGWPLDSTTPPTSLVPLSIQFGHSKTYSPIIQAQLDSWSSDLFTYTCTTGFGKSQQTHYFTIARVRIPKSLPHILLLSKASRADVQRDITNGQSLQLEGDFGDYFKLQIEEGQQIDVLRVLTPDVMQALIVNNKTEDIEIAGDCMYFILNGDDRDLTAVQSLIESAVTLTDEISENIKLATYTPAPVVGSETTQPTA
jgi:hypothetical protein